MGASAGDPPRIAVDTMGGDLGPAEVIAGVRLALDEFEGLSALTLLGDEAQLKAALAQHGLSDHPAVRLVFTTEVIAMEDKPLQALKRKKDSSMVRAIELAKAGEAAAVVSSGNTGALMAGGTLRLRTLDGVDRPALACVVPRAGGHFALIDAGANPEAEPHHLVHNAILGTHFARTILGVARPRVGLLTIGTEEGKGNKLVAEAHELLKRVGEGGVIHYAGLTEGFQIFTDHCDVAVCDGFVGNLLLKSWESLAKFFGATLKAELKANPLRMSGALLAKGALDALKHRINPENYAGAPLMGLRGNVLKAHGSSNRHAWKYALRAASDMVRQDVLHRIEADVAQANRLLAPVPPTPATAAA